MRKLKQVLQKITTFTIWIVLALALVGQTVSASYGLSSMCESLGTKSIQIDGDASQHHKALADAKSCCEELSNSSHNNCELHSCVIVGIQPYKFVHSVTFNASQYYLDLHHLDVLITIDNLYRPPIFV